MKKLKDILSVRKIQKEIQSDLGDLIRVEMIFYINETIKKDCNTTSISIDKDIKYDFECTLNYDCKKDMYFLEARVFKKEDGSMVNSYLRILNSNLETIDDVIDDVWEYGEWKLAC